MRGHIERGELAAAIGQCRGTLLPDRDEDWVRRARADHEEREIALLDRLADDADAAGDATTATAWSRRRCALTPLDEPAHCALMRRLAATGDRAGALLVGRALITRLRAELGAGPGPAVRAAIAAMRAPTGTAPPTATTRRPLFGRRRELVALTEAWASARAGHGRVVLITGEGGIGKTRLVGELADRADNAGARVAVGAGVDVGGAAPLAVWQELARELVRVVAPPPEHASWPAELGRLAPDLAGTLGRPEVSAPVAAPELERLRITDAVLRLVEWAATGRPVLLVAEDLHRADHASMQLCAHLGRRVPRLPLLLVLTRRDRPARPESDALVAELGGRGVEVDEIEVGPLAPDEVAAIARSVAALDAAQVAATVEAADGSPLLAVERARALAAGSTAPPVTLRATVRAAIGALPGGGRDLAECLAVAGRALRGDEVDALALRDRACAEDLLLDTGLVQRAAGGVGFRHALLAEAARADVPDPVSRHHRVGLAIESAAGHRPGGRDGVAGEVARHLRHAGRDDLATERWHRAARHARSVGALHEAAQCWSEVVRGDPDSALARLELAEVHGWLGQSDAFEREWAEALDRCLPAQRAVAWCRRGTVFRTVICHPAVSLAAYREAWELLAPAADPALRVEVLVGLGWGEASLADPHDAVARLEEVAALTALDGDPDPVTTAETENVRLMAVIRMGRFAECEAIAVRGGRAAVRAGRPDLAYPIYVNAACALSAGGDLDGARRTAEAAVAASRGIAVLEVPCQSALAFLLSRQGDHDTAVALTQEQLATAEASAEPETVAVARHDAGLVMLAAGRHDDAARLLAGGLESAARISRPATRLARAEALALGGRAREAADELRRAVEEPVGPEDQPWALIPRVARVQGLIAVARGDHAEGRRRFDEAVASWRRSRGQDPGTEYMTNFVDLGRPPVVGLIEPEREIARLHEELTALAPLVPQS